MSDCNHCNVPARAYFLICYALHAAVQRDLGVPARAYFLICYAQARRYSYKIDSSG